MVTTDFKLTKNINHIAFIMDGNGRWAKKRLLPRTMGHKKGCERIIEISDTCKEFGIKAMTLYAFSTENWNRPKDEIDFLFSYIETFFKGYIDKCMKEDISIRVMGDISKLPEATKDIINKAINMTKDNKSFHFNICLNYGSRQEILKATKEIAKDVKDGAISIDDIDDSLFSSYLYTKGLPNIDLMIRTSGEKRLSNFLLYQLAYSEFIFTDTYWPDFDREELIRCLKEFETRNRRFGGIDNK